MRNGLGETGLEKLGGTINQIGLRTGLWGSDDSKIHEANAAIKGPTPAVIPPAAPMDKAPAATKTVAPVESSLRAPQVPQGPQGIISSTQPNGIRSFAGMNITSGEDPQNLAARKTERDALTQKDIALGNQMQADRVAQENAGYANQKAQLDTSLRIWDEAERKRERQTADTRASSIHPGTRERGKEALAKLDAEKMEGMRQQGETLRSGATNDAQLAARRMDNQTKLRGDQMQYDAAIHGHETSARTARLQGQREAFYKDREFERNVANDRFTQKSDANKAWAEELKNSYTRTDADGKTSTDHQLVGDHVRATQSFLEGRAKDAEKMGDAKLAARIRASDVTGMTAADKLTIEQGVRMKDIVRKNHGLMGADFNEDNDPASYKIVGQDGNSYILANKSTVPKYLVDGGRSWAHPSTWINPTSSNAFAQLGQPQK